MPRAFASFMAFALVAVLIGAAVGACTATVVPMAAALCAAVGEGLR